MEDTEALVEGAVMEDSGSNGGRFGEELAGERTPQTRLYRSPVKGGGGGLGNGSSKDLGRGGSDVWKEAGAKRQGGQESCGLTSKQERRGVCPDGTPPVGQETRGKETARDQAHLEALQPWGEATMWRR
jgi:hypothetical protein